MKLRDRQLLLSLGITPTNRLSIFGLHLNYNPKSSYWRVISEGEVVSVSKSLEHLLKDVGVIDHWEPTRLQDKESGRELHLQERRRQNKNRINREHYHRNKGKVK